MLWCILRTSGGRTLALEASLSGAGFDVWTPKELKTRKRARSTITVEQAVPIAPTLVFASADRLRDLFAITILPASPHPDFSVFRHAGRVPLIGDEAIAGLRDAQRDADSAYQRVLDERTRKQQRDERVALLRTERARRKLLRAERCAFAAGAEVIVTEMPALSGLSGTVIANKGAAAVVCFGGALVMTIEAWRLSPNDVNEIAA